jgi:hypothetical protein
MGHGVTRTMSGSGLPAGKASPDALVFIGACGKVMCGQQPGQDADVLGSKTIIRLIL